MSNEIERAQDELVSEFHLFDDWMGRYEYLIDLGKQACISTAPAMPRSCGD